MRKRKNNEFSSEDSGEDHFESESKKRTFRQVLLSNKDKNNINLILRKKLEKK